MSNKTRIMLLWAVLGAGVAAVFNLINALTGGTWVLSVGAALGAAAVARLVYRRSIGSMMNDHSVVPTDHGPGRPDRRHRGVLAARLTVL